MRRYQVTCRLLDGRVVTSKVFRLLRTARSYADFMEERAYGRWTVEIDVIRRRAR